MVMGEAYDPSDPELARARVRVRDLTHRLNASRATEQALRLQLCSRIFAQGGDTVTVEPPFHCDYGFNIELGRQVFFNFNCIIIDVCRVRIGDRTRFGPGTQILTALHPFDLPRRRTEQFGRPVEIGADVWVGAGALILPGVTIGTGAVIGAGSVVTRDIPAMVFAAGNPCRIIRAISEDPLPG
jgi:maltose O-acetyltransferase